MGHAKEIKEEIRFTSELGDLLEIMKNIAIFQFYALRRKEERFERFFDVLKDFFRMLKRGTEHYLIGPETDKACIVMITSNEGFMGGLNFQVIQLAMEQKYFDDADLVIVGERGARYLKEMNREFASFGGAADAAERYELATRLKDYVMKGFREKRFGRAFVSYPKPRSFMTQTVEMVQILPLAPDISEQSYEKDASLIVESPIAGIIEFMVDQFAEERLIQILEDSKLSEFSARVIHLEKSGQELTEKKRQLKLSYFRAYHEMIDKSTRELFSAQVILKRKR